MRINEVLAMESGEVVCENNQAVITIAKKGDAVTFHPSVPVGTPVLSREVFETLYADKRFRLPEKRQKTADKPAT